LRCDEAPIKSDSTVLNRELDVQHIIYIGAIKGI
jgi:hypothetical protein